MGQPDTDNDVPTPKKLKIEPLSDQLPTDYVDSPSSPMLLAESHVSTPTTHRPHQWPLSIQSVSSANKQTTLQPLELFKQATSSNQFQVIHQIKQQPVFEHLHSDSMELLNADVAEVPVFNEEYGDGCVDQEGSDMNSFMFSANLLPDRFAERLAKMEENQNTIINKLNVVIDRQTGIENMVTRCLKTISELLSQVNAKLDILAHLMDRAEQPLKFQQSRRHSNQ